VGQRTTAEALATLSLQADRQLGLFTRSQAYKAGVTWRWLQLHVHSGQLAAVEPGVFLLPGRSRTWEVEALAACLACGRSARLAYGTAARIWSLADGRTSSLHVLVRAGVRSGTGAKVHIHHARNLVNADTALFGHLPVTTVARTILDLATVLSSDRIERIVDDALVRDLTTVPLLTASLRRNSGRGRTGCGAVRSALEEWSAGPLESHAEVDLARWLRRCGLPRPARQYDIKRPDGSEARVDFAWPGRLVVLEMDGYAHHHGPRKLAADHERRTALAAQGWMVLTTTPSELRQGAPALRDALERLLA
jgi:very-short-patch-repair endonuclease